MEGEIVSRSAAEIVNFLEKSVKPQFGYLICYKKKIKELESEIEKLKVEKTRIQGMVKSAEDCAEIIEPDVSNWLTEVQNMEDEVGKFLEEKVNKNKKCFKCWCPDLRWRYRLGKGAEFKKASVIALKDEGSEFKTLPVGHTAPFPEELQFASSGNYMNFNSRASVFNEIMGALKDSEVNLIGVHGPGGAGKTTLVEEAAKQAKKDGLFEEIVMAIVSKDANVRKIQEELASKLNLTYTKDSEVGRRGQLWNRLKEGNKKILVIMDDVWQKLDMKEIGIPIADGGRGCKVLLTTRRESVCQKMEVQKDFPIAVLEEQEAWSLFEKAVGNFVVPQSVAEEVCKECGGLPSAVVAVGAALKGKEGHVWDDALNQLKNSSVQEIPDIDQKMYMSLKWSYDYLEHEDAKACFLLCCLFPEDANIPIEDLVRHCMALRLLRHAETLEKARSRVQAMVDLLKSSCLLLHCENENYVKMHYVIRDVAISITNGKQEGQGQQWPNKQQFLVKHGVQKWPEEGTWKLFTAVSIMADKMDELPGDLQCPELHTLLLNCRSNYLVGVPDVDVPDPFFNGMKKLTVLYLAGDMLSLPSSFTNLVNLRMLQISDCHLRDIAVINKLKNSLEILILGADNIEELAPEIGELTRLRLLDLEECDSLEVIPQGVISKLVRLEELYISQDFDQWEAGTTSNEEKSNISLTELKSLKQLTTLHIHIPDVTLLPNDLCFENLIKFQISVGGRFDSDDRQYSSRMLKLEGFHLNPKFNGLIHRAEILHLRNLEGLETLFHGTHDRRVSNLKYLEVIDCHDLEYLLVKPEWLFSKLTEVVIENCSRLKYVCSSFCAKGLRQLRRLHISNCEIMEGIVEIEKEIYEEEPVNMMIDFSQLRYMKLKGLPKLISFYPCAAEQSLFNEKVIFPKLKKISAVNLASFREIHLGPIMTNVEGSLEEVRLEGFDQITLVSSPYLMQRFISLHKLVLRNCRLRVTQHFDNHNGPHGEEEQVEPHIEVKLLKLYGLAELTCLWKKDPFAVLALHNLKFLAIYNCSPLRNLFTHSVASSLKQLLTLYVTSCELMEEVVTNEGEEEAIEVNIEFPKLSLLMLVNLPNLESFCRANYTFNFPSLNLVWLIRCPKMQTFTSGQARMPKIGIITGEEEHFWTEDLNKYLKEEEIATRLDDLEGNALYNKLHKELIDEGINIDEEIEEIGDCT